MKENSNSHEDVVSRFISYGESNFESNVAPNRPRQSAAQLGVLRLIYAFRFSGHLRANLDPLQRPRHHSTPPFTLEEFGLYESDLDTTFDMGSYQGPNCNTLRELFDSLNKTYCSALVSSICTFQTLKKESGFKPRLKPCPWKRQYSRIQKMATSKNHRCRSL